MKDGILLKVLLNKRNGQQSVVIPSKFGKMPEKIKVIIPQPKEDLLWGKFKIQNNK